MTRRAARPEPVRDLFDAPITWTPPKEFTDYLAEREAAKVGLAVVAPPSAEAPAPAPELVPEPDEPSAPEPAPAPAPAARRNFAAAVERVQSGNLMVIRERGEHSHHTYRAFERADAFFYYVTIDELTWGRIDRRRPLRELDPYRDYGAIVSWEMECSLLAREVIRQLCPETRLAPGETATGAGVYDGPGYISVTVDPEVRYQAARAREVPA